MQTKKIFSSCFLVLALALAPSFVQGATPTKVFVLYFLQSEKVDHKASPLFTRALAQELKDQKIFDQVILGAPQKEEDAFFVSGRIQSYKENESMVVDLGVMDVKTGLLILQISFTQETQTKKSFLGKDPLFQESAQKAASLLLGIRAGPVSINIAEITQKKKNELLEESRKKPVLAAPVEQSLTGSAPAGTDPVLHETHNYFNKFDARSVRLLKRQSLPFLQPAPVSAQIKTGSFKEDRPAKDARAEQEGVLSQQEKELLQTQKNAKAPLGGNFTFFRRN